MSIELTYQVIRLSSHLSALHGQRPMIIPPLIPHGNALSQDEHVETE